MNFLEELGFSKEVIAEMESTFPESVISKMIKYQDIAICNINYLKELGIPNYVEAFKNYYNMFFIDASQFRAIFEKYNKEDLIEKLENNIALIEFL